MNNIELFAMSSRFKVISILIIVVAAVGTIYLWTADIPAPSEKVSKTLSNDRFD